MTYLIVRELIECRKEAVQYVLIQYKQERNAFERRSGMLAGTIDKVGIFAAIAGLVMTVNNLQHLGGVIPWGGILGPLLLFFYGLALSAVHLTQKMDRVIAILEFSIQLRN